ncbi:MAG: PfkB family carbohydrate kinase [Clostridia bacterium]|nr:PfkB family carbohydrate kinase [Clostridia bacterium]
MKEFDIVILGQPSLDINTDFGGETVTGVGGAVVYSGYSAAATGASVAVVPKCNPAQIDLEKVFAASRGVSIFPLYSPSCTSIENIYHTADRERRTCHAISLIEPYRVDEIPDVKTRLYQIAGLVSGDIGEDMIEYAANRAMAAVDVQFLLRRAENGNMVFYDWEDKLKYLPMIRFLKTDAAEAEIITGLADRAAAAKQLHAWGAKEIMITHNTEALVYDGKQIYTAPLKPRNLTGRTGRGDTIFAAYLCERLKNDIAASLRFSAALVSLKMETPGPFTASREDVDAYCEQWYDL